MKPQGLPDDLGPDPRRGPLPASSVSGVVVQIYELGQAPTRLVLIEYLLRPLSAQAVLTVGGGVFGRIWFRHGWREFRIEPDDLEDVKIAHLHEVVERVRLEHANTLRVLPSALLASWLQEPGTASPRLLALFETLVCLCADTPAILRQDPGAAGQVRAVGAGSRSAEPASMPEALAFRRPSGTPVVDRAIVNTQRIDTPSAAGVGPRFASQPREPVLALPADGPTPGPRRESRSPGFE